MDGIIWRLRIWLWANRPVVCYQCRRIVRNRHAKPANHTVLGWVQLCPECYRAVYEPWGMAERR